MLRLHRAERADHLADALATIVADPPDDPFTPEIVAVPTAGVERWLAQHLAGRLGTRPGRADGVCANVEFPFPGRLVARAVDEATGVDPATDPWPPERSVWALLDVVMASAQERWLGPLAIHATGPDDDAEGDADPAGSSGARRFTAVRHVADLFDRYGVHRPAMVRAWAAGQDVDGDGRPLPADAAWQAELWRRLRERLGVASPAERLAAACARLRDEAGAVELPDRLSLFGLTRLPAGHLDVLHALGATRDVHLFLLHPSPALWARAADALAAGERDPSIAAGRHPLLTAWGRDAREMQLVLGSSVPEQPAGITDDTGTPVTLLGRLQADIRADRAPQGTPLPDEPDVRLLLDEDDSSVQVHAVHGRARQVEVLRDAILHALADDPTLEPRDVIVMCPDIDAFAPLIHAAFDGPDPDPDDTADPSDDRAVSLPVRLADRSIRQTNPVLGAVAALLDLAGGRLTTSQVVDFAGREPVRRRFRLDDDDLARIEEWAAGTGIRWGLDPVHRSPYKLGSLTTGTWRAGIDRILVGVAMAEDGQPLVGGVLPLDDVDSGDIDLAGRLAELVDRLDSALARFAGAHTSAGWADAIAAAASALTATSEADAWQRAQLAVLLDEVVAEAGATGEKVTLSLDEMRAVLADRLRGRPTRANFRTGSLTMCTLVPMRSVPHRVVCLLGLDDGAFPRRTAPDGDDLLARARRTGDHDPRSEDRQLLLDALGAATDRLIVTYTGRDERTNEPRPPAVPLGELLDVIDATARTRDGSRARDRVVIPHPLHSFDARNFTAGSLVPGRPWGFDPVALDGARTAATRAAASGKGDPLVTRTAGPLLQEPLPPRPDGAAGGRAAVVELDDLVRFVQHPVRAFLRQRLGISVFEDDEEPDDALPVELDALARWAVGQRLLEALLAGADPAACRAAELARGLLPPGALGARVVDRVLPDAVEIARVAGGEEVVGAASVQADVQLDGVALVGTVPGVVGDVIRAATFSRVGPKHRLAAWVRLLAVSASHPDRRFTAVTVGRGPRGTVCQARVGGPESDRAVSVLATLVALHRRGLCEPLPIYTKTSAAYAAERARGRPGEAAARREWASEWDWAREDREPEHELVLGRVVPFDELLAEAPADDESGPGWAMDEPSRFGRLARRLWDDLLAAERVVSR